MRLSTRGRFAITAMIDLALRQSATPVPLQDLAQRHRISMSYLEQMFAKLRQHGLVESTRGPGGGYRLARSASGISVADIIGAIEDEMGDRHREVQRETSPSAQAMTQDLWDALQSTVATYLKTVTLQSLADEQKAKGFQVQERKPVQKGVFQKPRPPVARPGTPNSVFALAQAFAPMHKA
ncbi:MAG: Rrf2 family transcriptional regulator [Rhodoferax sp.]|jgi:Rrf2 family iron-sulfur cluster assembly transcriptional regulator|nr:Rrf2 family transcriptional regulator [Rhodoferax sp.]